MAGPQTGSPPNHLILVCCHSIYTGGTSSDPHDESNWLLKSFQKSTATKQGEHETLIQHILAAISLYSQNPETGRIVFSGGPTNDSYPRLSESQSYLDVLQSLRPDMVMELTSGDANIILEENATDSYQNIIFSIITFKSYYHAYPKYITVIAPSFKRQRLINLHAKAMRWPQSQIVLHGIDPPFTSTSSI